MEEKFGVLFILVILFTIAMTIGATVLAMFNYVEMSAYMLKIQGNLFFSVVFTYIIYSIFNKEEK